MSLDPHLAERSGNSCELCASPENLSPIHVSFVPENENKVLLCSTCIGKLNSETLDSNHWRCLNTSMWSTVPAVQVLAWRLLTRLQQQGEGWAQDLLDMLYLEEDILNWAKAGVQNEESSEEKIIHKDSNGTVLQNGDSVVLIKDLDVKGGGFTAKRGTMVKNIVLVENNAGQIEGRVNGQQIVILTQFVKKS